MGNAGKNSVEMQMISRGVWIAFALTTKITFLANPNPMSTGLAFVEIKDSEAEAIFEQ